MHTDNRLRTTVPFGSYSQISLRLWYYSACCQKLEKNWDDRENLEESRAQCFKGSESI